MLNFLVRTVVTKNKTWRLLPGNLLPAAQLTRTSMTIPKLFDQWNEALQTGDPDGVVKLYAEDAGSFRLFDS